MSSSNQASNLQSIHNALKEYAEKTGIDLPSNPFTLKLDACDSVEGIVGLLEGQLKEFKEYREGNRRLINWLLPVVEVVHSLSGVIGEVVSLAPFPPAKAIFVGVNVLLEAAKGVGSSYDALVDLFECIGHFLNRLQIYTGITLTPSMKDIIVRILVEVLSALALARKQIKVGRFKKFARKLLGESEVEAVLIRLERLTQEEARMTGAQILEVVHGLMNNVKVAMDDGKVSIDGVRQALVVMQEIAEGINKIKRDLLQKEVRSWFSPPNPSDNHNIARSAYRGGTAVWFAGGSTFEKWMTTGSLMWIHGKPGSGKSVLCSTIIEQTRPLRDAGLGLMAYFYFDFRDRAKQDVRGLLSSLLVQFAARSDLFFHKLSALYSKYDDGLEKPNDDDLIQCLEDVLKLQGQPAIYIIVDGLDECPNNIGMISPRRQVLEFVKRLTNLPLQNLHICITSRPEADIRAALEPMASHSVSLHEEPGQKQDILTYIRYEVQKIQKWRPEDKTLVIDALSEKADGMFRWVVCQLERLCRCIPAIISHALGELPDTLDETYERSLLSIDEVNRPFARRLLHCLAVSVRPLRVEELAELFAVTFEDGKSAEYRPKFRLRDAQEAVLSACPSLVTVVNVDGSLVVQFSHFSVKEFLTSDRLAQAKAELSYYHILPRPAHTTLAQASLSVLLHLDARVNEDSRKNCPLTGYAARHWVDHIPFKNITRTVQSAMERLFDPAGPHFSAWVWLYDLDHPWAESTSEPRRRGPAAVPLYYAALSGFRDLVKHLIATCPHHVNARGGYYSTPLHAAVAKGHAEVASLLLQSGGDVHSLDNEGWTPLHRASRSGSSDIVRVLLNRHANVDVQNRKGETALALASGEGTAVETSLPLRCLRSADADSWDEMESSSFGPASGDGRLEVVNLLLSHHANVNSRDKKHRTPLHSASQYGRRDIVGRLVAGRADVNVKNDDLWSPLHLASGIGNLDIIQFLVQHRAAVDGGNRGNETPLMLASGIGRLDIARFLVKNGADVNARDEHGWTPLHRASRSGHLNLVEMLLSHGVDINVRNGNQETPLSLASGNGQFEVSCFLIKRAADVNSCDNKGWTPLHLASRNGNLPVLQLLLDNGVVVDVCSGDHQTALAIAAGHGNVEVSNFLIERGADANSADNKRSTPLISATRYGHLEVVRLLLERGADVNAQDMDLSASLHIASTNGDLKLAQLLIQYGADVGKRNKEQETPLNLASANGELEVARLLLESGANVDAQDRRGWTPSHATLQSGHLDLVKLLLERGADLRVRNLNDEAPLDLASRSGKREVATFLVSQRGNTQSRNSIGRTSRNRYPGVGRSHLSRGEGEDLRTSPLHTASKHGYLGIVQSLLNRGDDVNGRSAKRNTPLHWASSKGRLEVARLLLDHGADINSTDNLGRTPLHEASQYGHTDVVRLLIERGADVNAEEQKNWTPLHLAAKTGSLEMVRLILQSGANVRSTNDDGQTPSQVALARGERNIVQILTECGERGIRDVNEIGLSI